VRKLTQAEKDWLRAQRALLSPEVHIYSGRRFYRYTCPHCQGVNFSHGRNPDGIGTHAPCDFPRSQPERQGQGSRPYKASIPAGLDSRRQQEMFGGTR
jgi:hypothetical protein